MRDHGVNREAVLGGSLDHAHVADAEHRHVERTRDRRGAHGQHIHVVAHLLQALFMAHAEALLFVDNQQAEIAEFDVL